MDGLIVDGAFIGGRACNHKFGSMSPEKVRQMFPHKTIEPHYDEGKHCYWLALGKRGEAKAARLGLTHNQETGDKTPIYFLVAKYCGDTSAARDEALERVESLLSELPGLLANAGMAKRRRG